MPIMDVFKGDAFSATSLSTAIDKIDYVPDTLSQISGLLVEDPVYTKEIYIEERTTGAVVLPFSERGTPPHQTGGDKRVARPFSTLRFADASRITASELFAIRQFGSEINLKTLQEEVMRRQKKVLLNMNLTKEYHIFNLVTQAKVLDADGSVKWDWATEFEQAIPNEIDFDLDNANPAEGAVRKKCTAIRRTMMKNLKGAMPARIVGICGDNFWDDLTSHPEVVKTFTGWAAASDLRNNHGNAWSEFRYGDINFVNYRGTDDGGFGVNTDQCKFFPVGAGIFRWALSPGESFADLGKPGQRFYSNTLIDKDRDQWTDIEVYSYPLPICTMPSALAQARRT